MDMTSFVDLSLMSWRACFSKHLIRIWVRTNHRMVAVETRHSRPLRQRNEDDYLEAGGNGVMYIGSI